MTAQISDTVFYNNSEYSIAGVNGTGLFAPEQYGIKPAGISTACWRGYFCYYAVERDVLILTDLYLGLNESDRNKVRQANGLQIAGATVQKLNEVKRHAPFGVSGVHTPVSFTGGLLIARDGLHELMVNMGFHPAYKYRAVYELVFEQGKLTHSFDRSEQMAQIRARIPNEQLRYGDDSDDEAAVEKWVCECFSLDYAKSFP